MALMKFRESNMVRWTGARPGHNGEQVLEYGEAIAATVVVYTVPADKILFLSMFGVGNTGAATGYCSLYIYDAVPAVWRRLSKMHNRNSVNEGLRYCSCNPPIEIPGDYSLRIHSSIAGVNAWAVIHGWVE